MGLRDWFKEWTPLDRRAILQHGAKPRITGLVYGDVADLEDKDAIAAVNDLPKHGARWRRTSDGWERWSFLDEDWVSDPEREPDVLPGATSIGTVLRRSPAGDWVADDAEPSSIDAAEDPPPHPDWP